MHYESGAATHVGLVRKLNEDNHLVDEPHGVWLVADGMGGHRDGKLASTMIVEEARTIGNPVSAPDLLSRFRDRVRRANSQLTALGAGGQNVIGSTLAALLVFGRRYACLWAGDSRVYLIRGNAIRQISKDHTEVQELLDGGVITPDEARTWPRRNVITRAIGVDDEPHLDMVEGTLEDGDRFVICSDGLTGHVEPEDIHAIAASKSPQPACEALVQAALDGGGKDNVTVVILHVAGKQAATIVQDQRLQSQTQVITP